MGIFEIILFLVIALIVIPPDDLPQVMRAAGKVMRELRLASNTVMREISSAIDYDPPFNLLPPRFDDPSLSAPPVPVSPSSVTEVQSQSPAEDRPHTGIAPVPQASSAALDAAAEDQAPRPPEKPAAQPEASERLELPAPPAVKP